MFQINGEEDIENGLKNGPYVYELFSAIIHRGSALGGHHFAYIKSFSSGKWYEFNDSQVKDIPADAYMDTFGDANEKKIIF
jgi:ubiquitin carboxyl-terminal hydrolase 47